MGPAGHPRPKCTLHALSNQTCQDKERNIVFSLPNGAVGRVLTAWSARSTIAPGAAVVTNGLASLGRVAPSAGIHPDFT